MPEARLQRTREAYEPLSCEAVLDVLLGAAALPLTLSCGCRRTHRDPEHPDAPDVFICPQHQAMGRDYINRLSLERHVTAWGTR